MRITNAGVETVPDKNTVRQSLIEDRLSMVHKIFALHSNSFFIVNKCGNVNRATLRYVKV